ncbi:Putative lipoprotein required for motility [hydrothermal vent metagenome]|uniref:Putative lipoprotein required for motility n=1 Tax=hydrothermal vent metagenome TaxID=652676 RepID=A0A1W1BWV3_9ZZZZ
MKYLLILVTILSAATLSADEMKTETVTVPSASTINVNYPACTKDHSSSEKAHEHVVAPVAVPTPAPVMAEVSNVESAQDVLAAEERMLISVVGQGVAPMNTSSPAQAYALAKRAAVADAYRLIAEKVKGVRIDGQDLIKNMMVKRSTVRTSVAAMVRNANIVETTFKEGLCEVEMEIVISHAQFK